MTESVDIEDLIEYYEAEIGRLHTQIGVLRSKHETAARVRDEYAAQLQALTDNASTEV